MPPAFSHPIAFRKAIVLCLLLIISILEARAQQRPAPLLFVEDAAARQAASGAPLAAALRHSRPLTLDIVALRTALATAPLEVSAGVAKAAAPLVLALPLPDGSSGRFQVVESPVMESGLAAQFPTIKTYSGVGLDDPTATVRFDVTPHGFHAQVLSATGGTAYIDPVRATDQRHYLSFYRCDMAAGPMTCAVSTPSVANATWRNLGGAGPALRLTGSTLRTYRLAVAATGEYTATQGGTVALGQAAIVTAVNRVVGVFEKELAVRLVLVNNNSSLVYTDANSDPYTNNNPSSLLTENQTNMDAVIGSANYDIGHVFTTGGGGLAGLGVVCSSTRKAQGETGLSNPVGDAFYIDFVCHEMGHQLGGRHTFNSVSSNCGGNRSTGTAYELGSGSTIMAYAGICSPDNIQNNSDAYFQVVSYEEILTSLATTSCAATAATGNSPPAVTLPASGKVLPMSTPFRLTALGTDADGDALTYCWEQYDLGPSGGPTATQVAGETPPLFRSFSPSASPTRYFPRLSNLLANTTNIGERLPTVTRNLNFRVTVRDQHNGTQGVVGGLNSSPVLALSTTSAAGPFLVTAPNTAVTWAGGSVQTVTWNVAGTTANGVNCATVNLRLSTDGGLSYPTVLLANTVNNGSGTVTVPSVATTTARIMVEAADNYFFDISDANFTISAATACDAPSGLSVGSLTQTTASVSFTPSGSAVSYTVTTMPATTTQTVTASPVSLTGLTPGTSYTVSIVSACASSTTSTAATATFTTSPPPPCDAPTALAVGSLTQTTASVSFTPSATATNYTVTTVPATATQTVTASPVSLTGLTPGTSYTVKVVSSCTGGGTGPAAATFATPPTNDECAGAIVLTSAVSCVTTAGTVARATQSQSAIMCNGFTSTTAVDVWYRFTATGPNHVITASSAFDGVLELFTGACGSLSSLGCADANGANMSETLTLTTLTAGTSYAVRYYPYTDASTPAPANGSFTICVTGPTAPSAPSVTVTGISPAAELPGLPVVLTGTGFAAGATVSFGGVSATGVVVSSATSLTATVPAGAALGSSAMVVTVGGVPSASAPAFSVLKVYDGATAGACLSTTAYAATGDGQWHYLLASGQVVAAVQDTRAALGSVAVQFQVTGAAGAVRQDGLGRKYLDRNFHLTATNSTFTGSSVAVRFYGLASEMARLQAADPAATYAGLNVTQYRGANEDCELGNNDFTTGELRTLAAPASTPGGVAWFVAQASVTDHFSEFFLTNSPTPLPVELVNFAAERRGLAVQLTWHTANELRSNRFEIERSPDGRTFKVLGTVAAAGTSNILHAYAFTDGQLPVGHAMLYYRLRQVDTDGTGSYSPVRAVSVPDYASPLALFPNPTATAATLTGALPGAVVRIFDTLGRVVLITEADATGTAVLRWPTQTLASGVYLVRTGRASVRLSIAP